MPFKFKVSNDVIENSAEVAPAGIYELRLISFRPKKSSNGQSTNLNAMMVLVNHPDLEAKKIKVFDPLNTPGGAFYQADFAHAFGVPMETDGDSSWLPGDWDGDPTKFKEDTPETWVYKGPLLNRIAKVELVVDNYNGKDNNKIRRYFCAIPDCAKKFPKVMHRDNLIRNS